MAEVKVDVKVEDVKAEAEILPVLKFSQAHQTFSKVQGNQLYTAACFWYFVKFDS